MKDFTNQKRKMRAIKLKRIDCMVNLAENRMFYVKHLMIENRKRWKIVTSPGIRTTNKKSFFFLSLYFIVMDYIKAKECS